jgi:hypothetical protein
MSEEVIFLIEHFEMNTELEKLFSLGDSNFLSFFTTTLS